MRGTGKKIVALALGVALVVTSITTGGTEASAKMKLSKTKCTLQVGKTLKLKVKGTKKKIKWSSSKKKVATVSKKGVVKAKKAGKTNIIARVGKKKLVCRLTVKKKAAAGKSNDSKNTDIKKSNEELAKSMAASVEQAADGSLLFAIKNNNNCTINYASLTATWKDVRGTEKSKKLEIYFLPAGQTCYLAAKHYTDYTSDDDSTLLYVQQDLSTMKYSDIVVNKAYIETHDATWTAGIINNPLEPGKTWASIQVQNSSATKYDYMDMTVALYNKQGKLMSVETQDFTQDEDPYINPGGKWTFSYSFPQDFVNKGYWEVASYKRLYTMIRSKEIGWVVKY